MSETGKATVEDVETVLSTIPDEWLLTAEAIIHRRIQARDDLKRAVARIMAPPDP